MAVYLDSAATTPLRSEAFEAMLPFLHGEFANPSSPHSAGQRARRALDGARERTAAALHARPDEIIFTASGSEADCLAIFGLCMPTEGPRARLITSALEHHAVLHVADTLRARGHEVIVLPVDADGFVDEAALEAALTSGSSHGTRAPRSATLVSVMHANNEIGAIEPIARLAQLAHRHGALFHTDAVQTVGHIPVDVPSLGVDALSLSAHKFEGPKGVGALYMRTGLRPEPIVVGGEQEAGRRGGTENVAGIVGLSVALELATRDVQRQSAATTELRDTLIEGALQIPSATVNGPRRGRLPNNASIRFDGIEGHTMVLALDVAGFEVSTGSACTSGSLEPSHVLTAIGIPAHAARGTVRFSLGRGTTKADIERLLSTLPGIVERLRGLAGALVPRGGPSRIRE